MTRVCRRRHRCCFPPSDSTSFPAPHSLPQAADITVGRTAAEIAIGKKGAAVIHVVDRVLIPGDKFFNWSTKSTMP